MKKDRAKRSENHWIRKIIIGLISLGITVLVFKIAPDYKRNDITDRTNLIINNNNITENLKEDIFISEDGIIYLSEKDIENFFDNYIYYDEMYDQIITTSDTKVAVLPIGKHEITINGTTQRILGSATKIENTFYLPFSEMNNVYNIEVEYIEDTDRIIVTSLDRKLEKADIAKNVNVKWKNKTLSRTVDKIKKGEKIVVISTDENGWAKIRTNNGFIGYVKENNIANRTIVREKLENSTRLDGKVSLVWDYYSEYVSAPDRSGETIEGVNVVSPSFFILERLGKGKINDNANSGGEQYVNWAKENGYKVWAMFSNDSMIETTHEILNDYKLREKTIENLLTLAIKYKVDGINLDFENMYEDDKDLYTRFVVELYPRLKEYGMSLSVDVTAPDGSSTWSLCYDRYNISRNCDYIIFMAYDQYGTSSTTAGTTAGYDWVKLNLEKFLRDIESDKIILGIPLYTRTWLQDGQEDIPYVVDMNDIEEVLPNDAEIVWKEDVKQHYTEYQKNGNTYKMWIEDEASISEKLNLATENDLAGVAFWEKDRETEEIWQLVKEKILGE